MKSLTGTIIVLVVFSLVMGNFALAQNVPEGILSTYTISGSVGLSGVVMNSQPIKPVGSAESKPKSQTKKYPTALKLLDKYTQALDSTKSFISSWEGIANYSSKIPKLRLNIRNAKKFSRGHNRTDGKGRAFSQTYSWGHVNSRQPNLSKDTPFYIMTVNDRININYNHNRTVNDSISRGNIYYRSGDPRKGYFRTEALLGYFGNEIRLDERLKNADHISIRKESEMINGSHCYIIDADTEYGQYTVWLDSEHGYHPARIKSEVTEGDKFHSTNTIMYKGCSISQNVDIVRFESVDGVWVPMEQHIRGCRNFVKRDGYFSESQAQIKRTEIVLNPDHDALGSFADPLKNPEQDPELRNGTPIKMEGGLRGVWLNGKVVDKTGRVIMDCRIKKPAKK